MKTWTRRHTLIAGLGVILLTNAVALGGVLWNRSGEAESTLKLTQRELNRQTWGFDRENSGIMLNLVWQTLPREIGHLSDWNLRGDAPPWLDRARMAELGFDVEAIENPADGRRDRQLSKEVLLVLELDGPAYREFLERARRQAADEAGKADAAPDKADLQRTLKNVQDRLKRDENESSRLFVVDAGLDLAALRARYPNRAQYAIVRGRVSPWQHALGKHTVVAAGHVQSVLISSLNVPFAFRSRFEALDIDAMKHSRSSSAPFEATVAYGQRLEPWIVGLADPATSARQPAASAPNDLAVATH